MVVAAVASDANIQTDGALTAGTQGLETSSTRSDPTAAELLSIADGLLARDGSAAVIHAIEQRQADFERVAEFVNLSVANIDKAKNFGAETLPSIRTQKDFQRLYDTTIAGCVAVSSQAAILQRELGHYQDGEAGAQFRKLLSGLSERAVRASSELRQGSRPAQDEVAMREISDCRVVRIDALQRQAVSGLRSMLQSEFSKSDHRPEGLSSEAIGIIVDQYSKQTAKIIGNLRSDPLQGDIDREAAASTLNILSQVKSLKVPASAESPARSENLSDSMRSRMATALSSFVRSLEKRNEPQAESKNIGTHGAVVQLSIDDFGRGSIVFTDTHSRSSISYSIENRVASVSERLERLANVRALIDESNSLIRGLRVGEASDFHSLRQALGSLAEQNPHLRINDFPLADKIPGFKFERLPMGHLDSICRVFAGETKVALVQTGVEDGREHRVELAIKNGEFSATLSGPMSPGQSTPLRVKVVGNVDAVKHKDDRFNELARKIFESLDSNSGISTAVDSNPKHIINTLLDLKGCKVAKMSGVNIADSTTLSLDLAPQAEIKSIYQGKGSILSLDGSASDTKGIKVSGLWGHKKSQVHFSLKESMISDCRVALGSGSLENCTLRNVGINEVQESYSGSIGTVGKPITKNCELVGCEWKKTIFPDLAVGRRYYLAPDKSA
jgi:hypothetical protein